MAKVEMIPRNLAQITIGTTPARLTASSDKVRAAVIQADKDNSGSVYVGSSAVTSSGSGGGTRLAAGESFTYNMDDAMGDEDAILIDLTNVWIVGSLAGQKVNVQILDISSVTY